MQGKVPKRRQRELWGLHRVPLSTQHRTSQHRQVRKLLKTGKNHPKGLEGVVPRALTVLVLTSWTRKPQEI